MVEVSNELIREAKQGNMQAWESLLSKIYPIAWGRASSLLRDKDLAQDATQNALLKVYRNLCSLKDEQAFWGWWIRILTNEIYFLLRLRQKEVGNIEFQSMEGRSPSIEDHVLLKMELTEAIESLPFEQQQILLDVDLMGIELKEAAVRHDLPIGTVKSRLFRARTKVQEIINYQKHLRKGRLIMVNYDFTLSDRIYDYLEGTINAVDKLKFEEELNKNPELKANLDKHKSFLALLHSFTGKMSLTGEEINEKIKTTIDKIHDYEEVVHETHFENGVPKTLTSHIHFKSPALFKIESDNPVTGPFVLYLKDDYAISWVKATPKSIRTKVSKEYKERFNFPAELKRMVENKSVRIIATEYLNSRPTLHLHLQEKMAELGEMNTHLWIDKDTWMPMLTEYYNLNGDLIIRREVKGLKINQGLPDTFFDIEIPDNVMMEDSSSQEYTPPKEISTKEATRILGHVPYVPRDSHLYKVKHLWVTGDGASGVLVSQYTVFGEIKPAFVLTQGSFSSVSDNSLSDFENGPVKIQFNLEEIDGEIVYFNAVAAQTIVTWKYKDMFYLCSGQIERDRLLNIIEGLVQN